VALVLVLFQVGLSNAFDGRLASPHPLPNCVVVLPPAPRASPFPDDLGTLLPPLPWLLKPPVSFRLCALESEGLKAV
jgi:hypothetical protein